MPQWGMQGIVNGWVNLNNKHVVFSRGSAADERSRDGQVGSDPGSHVPLSRRKSDRNVGKGDNRKRESADTATTASSSMRLPREDPETRAIRRFNSRKNSRRLQRTISHSDLLREMALAQENNEKEAPRSRHADSETHTAESHISGSSSKQKSSHSASLTVQHSNQLAEDDLRSHSTLNGDRSSNSFSWMSGIVDKTADDNKASIALAQPHKTPQPVTTGKYLNETAFVQQYEQSKYRSGAARGNHASRSRTGAIEPASEPQHALKDPRSRRRQSADESGSTFMNDSSKTPTASLRRGNSNVSKDESGASSDSRNRVFSFHPPWLGPAPRNATTGAPMPCPSCEELDARVLALENDLEYLRSVALRSEYVCAGCEKQSSKRKKKYSKNLAGVNESSALNEASQRLIEVTARHKRQIEQMTRERSRWQHDMHCKLSKFAAMCKHWNEESAIRNEEATSLETELSATKMERNSLASEVQKLRAQLEFSEKRATQRQNLLETVAQYEDDGLNLAEEDVQKRDVIIVDLSARLDKALDTLEMEREQQRQRRQIIFPVARTNQTNTSPVSPMEVSRLKEELENTKEQVRASQAKEQQWKLRCEELEKLVKEEPR